MKKVLVILLSVFLIQLMMSSCSTRGESQIQNTSSTIQPRYGGSLVIGVSGDIDTFNPLFGRSALGQEVTHLVLLGLADLDDQGEFVPELAESWEHSADNLKLIYYLRKDARWSDGKPISAYDVKFTYDLLMDPTVGSPRQGYTDFIKQVLVQDSFTVVFEFTEAYPYQIFDTAGEVLPKHLLEHVDRRELQSHEFGRQPISSGPFLVHRWESKQYIELRANESYFAGRPYLDRVIFKVIPDPTNLFTQLQTNEIDMLLDVAPDKVAELNLNPDIQVFNVPGRVYNYIGYNEAHPFFKKPQIRQALTMAINRHEIIEALLYGFGAPCISPFLPILRWAYNDQIQELPFDPDGARKLLNREGWIDSDGDGWLDKAGKPFAFTLKTNAGNPLRADAAVIIQEQLKRIGVKLDIQILEWTAFLEHIGQKNFEAYLGGLSSSLYIDPTPIYHSSATDLFNYVGYANPRVDELIEKGRVEMSREKAAQIWKELQEIIYQDQPYTYLFWINRIVAVHRRFQNVTPITLSSLYQLEKWYEADIRPS